MKTSWLLLLLLAGAGARGQMVQVVATFPRDGGTPARVLVGAEQFADNTCEVQTSVDYVETDWSLGALYFCYIEDQMVLATFNIEIYPAQIFRSLNTPCAPGVLPGVGGDYLDEKPALDPALAAWRGYDLKGRRVRVGAEVLPQSSPDVHRYLAMPAVD